MRLPMPGPGAGTKQRRVDVRHVVCLVNGIGCICFHLHRLHHLQNTVSDKRRCGNVRRRKRQPSKVYQGGSSYIKNLSHRLLLCNSLSNHTSNINIIEGSPDDYHSNHVLALLQFLADPLDGAVITLVFVLDRRNRQVLKSKCIWEALKTKFQSRVNIHELTLKSRLSRSDFVIGARLSIDVSPEGDTKCDRNETLTRIQELEVDCDSRIISRTATEEDIVEWS